MVAQENGGVSVEQRLSELSLPKQSSGQLVPVGEARTVLPSPDLSGIKPVDTQTAPIGIINPPPDIRAIVDKSAVFVAKNGVSFEQRILKQQQNSAKFNFLKPGDPYHAYYRWKVSEQQGQEAGGQPASTADQQAKQAQQLQTAAAPAPAAIPAPIKPLVKPEDARYTVNVPEGIAALNLDIMRLCAQMVARNGTKFLKSLAERERLNPQFSFLKETHSLFGFFTALCDAYSSALMPPKDLTTRLHSDASDMSAVLERCLRRLEWDRVKEAEAKAAADQFEAERLAMQSIDWHDFTVVETIEFYEDEEEGLPAPLTRSDILILNKAQPESGDADADGAAAAPSAAAAGSAPMDEEERAMVAEAGAPQQGKAPIPPPQPDQDGDADMEVEEAEEPANMKIVRNYQRQDPRSRAAEAGRFVKSPITGELVAVDQMAEHMRVSLIDPKWRTQREAMLAKIRETTQAPDDEIGRNLIGLARHRPDVFGSTQEEVGALVQAGLAEANTTGTNRPVAWDGQTNKGPGLQNQIRAINDQRAQGEQAQARPIAPTPVMGPRPSSLPPPPVPRPAVPASLPPPPVRAPAPPPPRPPVQIPRPMPPPPVAVPRPMPPPPPQVQAARPPPQPPQLPLRPPISPMGAPGLPTPHAPPRPPAAPAPPSLPSAPMGQPPLGAPPGAPQPPAGGPDGPPDAKRARTEFVLEDEAEFLQRHPGASKVLILCPDSDESETLKGQLLEVEVASLRDTIGTLKARLADVLQLAANKQQLSRDGVGFLRNEQSLAHYNVGPTTQLSLSTRGRGGRRG